MQRAIHRYPQVAGIVEDEQLHPERLASWDVIGRLSMIVWRGIHPWVKPWAQQCPRQFFECAQLLFALHLV